MARILIIVAALGLGFSLGWLAHPATEQLVVPSVQAEAPRSVPEAVAAVIPISPVAPAAQPAESRDSHRARLQTLRWLRDSGRPVHFQVFHGDKFNPMLAEMLGLNETEIARLDQAMRTAKTQVEAARAAAAVSRLGEDGTLQVEIPALDVAASGAIYDQVHDALKHTLGSERLETFSELAGEDFERGFDRFGLNPVRYEISPPSRGPGNGQTVMLPYKRFYVDATGNSHGSSSGQLLVKDIAQHDALLAKVLPPSFTAEAAGP